MKMMPQYQFGGSAAKNMSHLNSASENAKEEKEKIREYTVRLILCFVLCVGLTIMVATLIIQGVLELNQISVNTKRIDEYNNFTQNQWQPVANNFTDFLIFALSSEGFSNTPTMLDPTNFARSIPDDTFFFLEPITTNYKDTSNFIYFGPQEYKNGITTLTFLKNVTVPKFKTTTTQGGKMSACVGTWYADNSTCVSLSVLSATCLLFDMENQKIVDSTCYDTGSPGVSAGIYSSIMVQRRTYASSGLLEIREVRDPFVGLFKRTAGSLKFGAGLIKYLWSGLTLILYPLFPYFLLIVVLILIIRKLVLLKCIDGSVEEELLANQKRETK